MINLATVIKFYRLGGLNNKHLCLMFLESGKSKTTVVQSDSGKDIFPVFSQDEETERSVSFCFYSY